DLSTQHTFPTRRSSDLTTLAPAPALRVSPGEVEPGKTAPERLGQVPDQRRKGRNPARSRERAWRNHQYPEPPLRPDSAILAGGRSEEHTSELQSRVDLV